MKRADEQRKVSDYVNIVNLKKEAFFKCLDEIISHYAGEGKYGFSYAIEKNNSFGITEFNIREIIDGIQEYGYEVDCNLIKKNAVRGYQGTLAYLNISWAKKENNNE